ncbi:protein IWS1 homolog [Paramacrobiotus metropolitanus]|uniref:protein IWS1 homolog n=1 Tax=Paramacrobiotus metropolitanus TaxID=2943436 RepID=UPI0024464819|nr:protein IWS1 homolog [Paramacrobiotus metropolitanus]
MSLNEFAQEQAFEETPDESFGLEHVESAEKAHLNNPLGLSDRDVQLDLDEYSQEDVGNGTELPDPENGTGQTSNGSPAENNDDEPDESGTSKNMPNAEDLFGSDHSDDEGNAAGPSASEQTKEHGERRKADDDDDNASHTGSIKSDPGDDKMTDFDIMMKKKSEERRRTHRRKKRQDVDLINDHDERITEIITEMKAAADTDRKANARGECATKKITMLPRIMNILRKQDLQTAFLDCGILSPLADWLAPLPDGNLTHLKIRESILKILEDMSSISPEQLKNSGIGKAVMLLYKHPKELKENRTRAGKLIQEWSRPIFGTSTNYRSMSREERMERDVELLSKRRLSMDEQSDSDDEGGPSTPNNQKKRRSTAETPEDDPNKNVPRARVPQPSLRDYVIRPQSKISMESAEGTRRSSSGAKPQNRFEKRIRGMKEQQRSTSKRSAGHLSLEGRKM